jgi:hypothetical protein
MSCEAARLAIGADPGASSPELEAHLAGCQACRQFRDEMRALDSDIRRALEQPPQLARRRVRRPVFAWQQWAMAASVLVACFAVVGVWLLRPSDTLAHEVVVHVQHEPDSWFAAHDVTAPGIDRAFSRAGMALDVTSDRIVYAQSCWFRGHYVPHLVVQTAHGPATVLVLRHETVKGRRTFHEAGLSGVIVPASGEGSIAVLTRGADGADGADEVAGEMQHDLTWVAPAADGR